MGSRAGRIAVLRSATRDGEARRAWHRRRFRIRRRGLVSILALLLCAGASDALDIPASAQSTPGSYHLVETWTDRGLAPQASLFGAPVDLSSRPDGRLYVLDAAAPALHELHPDGRPRSLRALPGAATALRIDAGTESVLVLGREGDRWRIDRWLAEERFAPTLWLDPPDAMDYVDLAVDSARPDDPPSGADASIWLLTVDPEAERPPRLERRGHDGSLQLERDLRSLFLPGCERLEARALDVDDRGTVHLAIARDERACPDPNAPTPEPGDPRPPPIDGIVQLDADAQRAHLPRPMPPPDDIALAGRRILVSAGASLLDGQSGATIATLPSATGAPAPRLSVDLAVDGRAHLAASGCPHPGLFRLDAESGGPISRLGHMASPPPGGPLLPIALSAGDEITLLRGAVDPIGLRYDPEAHAPSLQHWSPAGQPLGSQALCGERIPPPARQRAFDLSGAAGLHFAMAADRVSAWDAGPGPRWQWAEAGAHFLAVDADETGLSLLDAAGRQILQLDLDGTELARWPWTTAAEDRLPSDLARAGQRVYLADAGRGRIDILESGVESGGFELHGAPARIAAGPDGDLYALVREGMVLRYAPDGGLRAAWPLPEGAGLAPLDIAVDARGRVLVGFARFLPPGPDRDLGRRTVLDAGMWVFEARPASPPLEPAPAGESCALRADARALPARLPLGAQTTVELSLEGRCPGWQEPQHLVVVLDTAAREGPGPAFERAQAGLMAFLSGLDVENVWLGLAASDGQGLPADLPLSHDLDALRARIASARPAGRPSLAEAVGRARAMLADPPLLPDAQRRLLLVLAGGEPEAELVRALQAARDQGLDPIVLAYRDQGGPGETGLEALAPDPADRFIDLAPIDVAPLVERAGTWRLEEGLLEAARVQEPLPANMRYVMGSAEPPADYDAAAHRLSWDLGVAPARPGLQLRYQLEPAEAGRWPTSLGAAADIVDHYGSARALAFPRPDVEVYRPPTPAPPQPIYLPFALRSACLPGQVPLDIVLVMDVSGSMAEPEGIGTKLDAARAAAGTLLELLQLPRDRVALVAFDAEARRAIGLSGDRDAVAEALSSLETGQGTRIDLGLAEAGRVLAESPRDAARRNVILLTDGLQSGSAEPVIEAAGALREAGSRLFAIGLGADVDEAMLRRIASSPEDSLTSPSAAELAGLYQDILAAIDCGD